MAPVPAPAEKATDLLQKLSLESKNKTFDSPEVVKKPSGIQYGPANGVEAPKFQISSSERSITPVHLDYNMSSLPNAYPSTAYYYGGYDGSLGEWDEYYRYTNPEGVEVPHGVYSDVYHQGYGYPPYGAYPSSGLPVTTLAHDCQMYGAQHYQYPSSYFQPQAAYSSNSAPIPQGGATPPVVTDQSSVTVDSAKLNSNGVANFSENGKKGSVPSKQGQESSPFISGGAYGGGVLLGGHPSSGHQDTRFSYDGIRSPVPWYDGPAYSPSYLRSATTNHVSSTFSHKASLASSRNQNGLNAPRQTQAMGPTATSVMNRIYPNMGVYGQCGSTHRSSIAYGSNIYDSRTSGRWGLFADSNYKPRVRSNGFYSYSNENSDGLSELNRGPRANRLKIQKGPTITLAVRGQSLSSNENIEDPGVSPDQEKYNRADFPDKYSNAKFFVIKSYSEDDIHQSIKYSVWASTPNGNKKLDDAYKEAQDQADRCPVFLFFSVNTSGQFVGIAEMVGPVDFNKTVDYWQQDKWNGCFIVKWHVVKDVPNNVLKHITVENNDNKPVTNSRDTQEVKLEQGLQMLKIFKEYSNKTSILDDFSFYEGRQKAMQEKRAKQQQLNKQIVDIKLVDPVDVKGKDESKVDQPKDSRPVTEKKAVANGVASAC
ncbi:Cleavage and polyadenylation specificity factor CPSF30 [Apostasia shenzhenica]|uniref:YTH domain-containing family protein n=1 Tax=Apostasia shenzhenica TaxID=1088818 RepID=A0A2I0A5V2_9ASPA|nr:Cleavage and polyadenylation specificity factor CPSF30 [Apostasia shenzhenica]